MERGCVVLLLVLLICSCVLALTSGVGLHFELTHVDAKGGRYTTTERARRAVDRSRRRLAAFMSSAGHGDVRAPVQRAQGEYFTEYLIGDPPQRAEAIVDTGSNLVWTQCTDCLAAVADRCFEQHLPLYNYSASRSAKPVPCTDALCQANQYGHFCDRDGSCVFLDEFGSGTIAGHLGTEVFAFQSGAADLAFGCVKASSIDPGSLVGTSGLIGLGRGRLSLVSQTGAGKFSYCLTPYDSDGKAASHLFVGASANLAGESPVVSIKFVKNPTDPPYNGVYFLPLVGLTVGETKLPIPSSLFDLRQVGAGNWSGGVFIDSGSTITSLVDGAYKALVDELTKQIGGSFVRPPPAMGGERLAPCLARGDIEKKAPRLVLHFSGGADMALPPVNYWMRVDNFTACMAINRSNNTMSTIGNFQQQNMHLLYDLDQGQLSFQLATCSKL